MSVKCSQSEILTRLFSNGLRMYLQPIFNLLTGNIIKMEALARVEMEDGRILLPCDFLPDLSSRDLDKLFYTGLDQILVWFKTNGVKYDVGANKLGLSINAPPSFLMSDDAATRIASMLDQYGVAPERLTIEILETHRINANEQFETIRKIKERGIQLALDDLGSGHSSLLRLATHPFDVVKIDRGLLSNIHTRPIQVFTVIRSLIEMAANLRCQLIVEGLEDMATIEAMRFIGCEHGQGYGLARPMSQSRLEYWRLDVRHQKCPEWCALTITTKLGALAFLWMGMRKGFHLPADKLQPLGDWLIRCVVEQERRAL